MLATTDTERYVHRSPNLNAVFTSARDLAERLKLLSEELDRLSGEIVQSGSVTTQHSFSGARIDALINNLQSQRDAMRELDQTDEQIQK
jgi:pantoate kinase